MEARRGLAAVLAVAALSACSTIVPNANVQLTPSVTMSAERLVMSAGAAALLYVVYDPLAPNWRIEEQLLREDTIALSMRAKRFRTGGDGEAMLILRRRAGQLQREKGYAGYRILDFSQGIESSTPIAQLYSEATIQFVRAEASPTQP